MSTTSSSSSSSSSGMGGGDGGTGMATLKTAADTLSPLDATPDPMGNTIYFTAVDPVNGPGVFKVPADGSNTTPTAVKVGDPFAAPFGISTSSDGTQLYIADPGAVDPTSNVDIGLIFAMPAGGGTPVALAGSEQTRARSLDVVKEGSADVIYFTGIDKTDSSPGIFKMPASGGSVSVVAKGSPFLDPSGHRGRGRRDDLRRRHGRREHERRDDHQDPEGRRGGRLLPRAARRLPGRRGALPG
jgi:hypothetical protein